MTLKGLSAFELSKIFNEGTKRFYSEGTLALRN